LWLCASEHHFALNSTGASNFHPHFNSVMDAALMNQQKSTLFSLFAGGQYKSSSIPVTEAWAVLGVPQEIEDDDSPERYISIGLQAHLSIDITT